MHNKRESKFELLRIVLTLMIITLHYNNGSMGGILSNVMPGSINYYLTYIIESICIIAVNVFILITGYYMNSKRKIEISKIVKLIYLCAFYGILIYIICIFTNKIQFNIETFKKLIDTIFSRWFVVIYCILYLLIPYINKLINSISKNQFATLIIIFLLVFSIWPTFYTNTTVKDSGYGILNFITLYLIGAYIKLYLNEFNSFNISMLIYILFTAITFILSLENKKYFNYNSVFNIISAVAFFEIFKSLNIKECKAINKLATFTFSTYIIHENKFIVADLYKKIFKTTEFYQSTYIIINLIVSVIGIYIICVIIEWCRRLLAERLIDTKIDNIKMKIEV